jgi:hydrogenase maturation factor
VIDEEEAKRTMDELKLMGEDLELGESVMNNK